MDNKEQLTECCGSGSKNSKEKWKEIEGYNGDYLVSDKGRILSKKRGRVKYRKLTKDSYGYYVLVLTNNGKRKHLKVHRIVAETFIENPDLKKSVNHKNGIKTDNRVENLEWMSFRENMIHAYDNNLIKSIEETGVSKITMNEANQIRSILEQKMCTKKDISACYGISKSNINHIISNRIWKC